MAKTVPLSRTYPDAGTPVSTLVFREPKWPDYMAIGDIEEWQPVPGGGGSYLIRHGDRIAAYADRLCQTPEATVVIPQLDLVDTLAVEAAITGFFEEAHRRLASPTGSSGASDGGTATLPG